MTVKEDFGKQRPIVEVQNAAKRARAERAVLCVNCAEQYLSDRQVAMRFDISKATVWRWHGTNPDFPRRVRLSSGTSRWKLSELVKFEHKMQINEPSPSAAEAETGET